VWHQSAILRDVAHAPPECDGIQAGHIHAIDQDPALVRLYHPVEAAKKRGFSSSALANESKALARRGMEGNIIQRRDGVIALARVLRGETGRGYLG
jgi:hypothetical protein